MIFRCSFAVAIALIHGALFVQAAEPASPPATNGSTDNIANLVAALGDNSFARREQATTELLRIGLPASTELIDATRHVDPEIRYRSQRILALVREADFQRRLAAFAADRNPEAGHNLPGWNRFRRDVGQDANARALFVDMQRADPQLLAALDIGEKESRDALKTRAIEYQTAMRFFQMQLQGASVAAMLFVATNGADNLDVELSNFVIGYCHQQGFQEALRQPTRQTEMKKLLGAFITRCEGWANYQAMNLAIQHDIKEGAVAAEKVLKPQAAVVPNQVYLRQQALLTLARFGGDAHLPLIESLLEDKSSTGIARRVNNSNYVTQIRDIALATLVHLTKQSHKDYGFDMQNLRNPQTVFNPVALAFPNDEAREAAIRKWRESRMPTAANPK